MNSRIVLPPIDNMLSGMPTINLDLTPEIQQTLSMPAFPEQIPNPNNNFNFQQNAQNHMFNQNMNLVQVPAPRPQIHMMQHKMSAPIPEPEESDRSTPYLLQDDLLILKAIQAFFGSSYNGKVPWSFWNAFRATTGVNRSNSSLYHHWNGAMKKKYHSFLSKGKLAECIAWLEKAVDTSSPSIGSPVMSPAEPTGQPLFHNFSEPPRAFENSSPMMTKPGFRASIWNCFFFILFYLGYSI